VGQGMKGVEQQEIQICCCFEGGDRYNTPPRLRDYLIAYLRPGGLQMLFNKKMKTDVWALVGIVVMTIQTQQVTHKFIVIFDFSKLCLSLRFGC
jgi:hypothetical protein